MPLILRPIRPTSSDLTAHIRVYVSAFWHENGLLTLFYPNGYSDAARASDVASIRRRVLKSLAEQEEHKREKGQKFKGTRFFVVVDTDEREWKEEVLEVEKEQVMDFVTATECDEGKKEEEEEATSEGKIAGVAIWNFQPLDCSLEEIDAENERADEEAAGEDIPDADKNFLRGFKHALRKARKEYMKGKAHILLHILATDPAYHRRGVGRLAMQWGLDEADRLGLPIYLEASQMGKPLYERHGFQSVGLLDFSPRDFGKDVDNVTTIMIRPVKVAN